MEDISTVVGGMENMSIVIEWAKNNLSDEEKQSIDAIHDPVIIKSILKDLENRMKTSEGYKEMQVDIKVIISNLWQKSRKLLMTQNIQKTPFIELK